MTGKKSLGRKKSVSCANQASTEDIPEKIQEPKCFHKDANKRPPEKNEEYAAQKANSSSNLLLSREKIKGLLRANDKS